MEISHARQGYSYSTRHGYYSLRQQEDAEVSVVASSEFGGMSYSSTRSIKVATANAGAKRFVGFSIISIGTTVLVVVCLSLRSSNGLLWASVRDSTQLSLCPASCKRPGYYCVGDGYEYSERDCDGDGIPDPFCQNEDSKTGEISCGCLQSINNCNDNFPTFCPAFLRPRRNQLWASADQIAAKSPTLHPGMLIYLNVNHGDEVSKGDILAAVMSSGYVFSIKAPDYGIVSHVLSVRIGDHIAADTILVVMEKYTLGKPDKKIVGTLHNETKGGKPAREREPGSGLEVLKIESGATFKRWAVNVFDKMPKGGAVADVTGSDGKPTTVIWDGPTGMVVAQRQGMLPEDYLQPGAALIKVAQAIFVRHTVKINWKVHRGDTVALVWIGREVEPILATRDGIVVANTEMGLKEQIGFDTKLEADTFCRMGNHLPPLPGPFDKTMSEKGRNSQYKWLSFVKYDVYEGDKVEKGDLIALTREVMPDNKEGLGVEFRAGVEGFVTHLQPLSPGDLVGPDDDVFNIDPQVPGSLSQVPPWIWILMCILCCPMWLLALICYRAGPDPPKRKPRPPPPPMPEPSPSEEAEEEEEEPMPVPEPAPAFIMDIPVEEPEEAPPPEPVPVETPRPSGVPIYFDDEPYYLEYRPIGIKFRTRAPIQIEEFVFNSYGKTLGLRKGQTLTRIGDLDVREDHDFEMVSDDLTDALKDLPVWPLRLDFRTDASTNEIRTFNFTERPLGIMFSHHLPVTIEKFRPYSLAERCGVQLHWEIVRIADEETTPQAMKNNHGIEHSHAAYEHVDKHLLEGLHHLPYWPVRCEFKTRDGEIRIADFVEKPHGIKFAKKAVRVGALKPGCVAEELGVQIGEHLVRVMDEEINEDHDYKHANKLLDETMKHLPERRH